MSKSFRVSLIEFSSTFWTSSDKIAPLVEAVISAETAGRISEAAAVPSEGCGGELAATPGAEVAGSIATEAAGPLEVEAVTLETSVADAFVGAAAAAAAEEEEDSGGSRTSLLAEVD